MRRLDLELLPRRRVPRLAWIALVAALAVSADAGLRWLAAQDQLERAQAAAHPERPERARPAKPLDPTLARDLRQAERVVERLALPWDRLFQTLETASVDRVALLALEPDPQTGELSISGEAADYPAIVAYLEKLAEPGRLSGVHLVRHEMKQDDPQHPLTFTIAAEWRAKEESR